MESLKELLMAGAREKGICAPGYEEMRVDDIDALIDYYIQNPDWSMERDFPTLRTLKEHFSDIEDKGVYIGKTFHGEVLNDLQTYIFHNCKGTIKVGLNIEKGIIPMLYLGNKCRLRIVGWGDCKPRRKEERSAVPVHVFGENDVSARDNEYAVFKRHNSELI